MTRIHDNQSPHKEKLICEKVLGIWNQLNQLSFMCLILLFILLFCLSYYCSKKKLKWSNEKMREEREKLLKDIKINNAEIKRIQSEIKWVGFT